MRIFIFSILIIVAMQSQAQQYLGDFSRPFFPKAGQSELSLLYRNISVNSKDEQSGIPIEIDGNISGIRADYNYGLSIACCSE